MPPPFTTPQPMGAPTMGAAPMQMAQAPDWRRQMMMANMLMGQGMNGPPVRHWAEGLGRLAQVVGGAYLANKAHTGENAQLDELEKALVERGMSLPGGMHLSALPEDVRNNLLANALNPAAEELTQVWDGQQMVWVPKSQAGGKPSAVPYAVDLQGDLMKANAGRSSTTINMPAGETQFFKSLGEKDAGTVTDARTASQSAQGLLSTMGQLEALLDQGVRTGSLAGFERDVGSLLTAVGIDPTSVGLQDPAALNMISKVTMDQVLSMVQQTKGAISNAEMQLFEAASAGLSQTPEGNRLLIQAGRDMAKRSLEYSTALNDWVAQGISPSAKGPNGKTFYQTWDEMTAGKPAISEDLQKAIKTYAPKAPEAPAVAPAASTSTQIPTNPQPGQIINGFRFKGGDPADQNSWEVVQ